MEPVQETTVITGPSQEDRTYAMLLHLSQFAGYLIPFAGLIVPLVMWLSKKDTNPYIDAHGKVVFNWIISAFIWGIISVILSFVVIGIFLLIALGICHIIFAIMGAIRANDGIVQNYPLTIKFFKV
ncbi:DUF4870 domain-containing protein [Pseudidiomarina sp. 1APP75-32.1]|uniref:DUF4870 domain-containing protein n=1 Tax=Pseudidiomarina terrestris TaxID=2820060 RepID=A0AAW7QY45_9GAMM|nr:MULTISPECIES: DUF4870 domain-containing protein [unclassified Pseudidiomarina]MDN7124371.1 DUF4870 domain-containing protein [Pseudidiomarina sp. 1APP75-32.1]MDN7126372.1 DUF4870 domain-containing protein [Pseudidiomarina sp. 1APR75-33.1]MDN7129338.1 DUF4870 domain-containing protein [Pseudidiomarina sp. 1APR75-15]MEA3587809.1 DUF4870 domain-containing protein [Pseudidiomarina sp. 1APP75-27a]